MSILHLKLIVLTEAYYYILLSLFKPLHGYGIMKKIAELSDGRVMLAAGTLYGALNKLEQNQWIKALPVNNFDHKKQYVITSQGKEIVINELKRLEELVNNGHKIMEDN
ncbi:PadR family transcriptional regulator [Lactobacillus sp. ESL0234]|uniref:PadR family transcriptional regulator n=1 Tax=Lactobacillus sp. ESL0234 TaxID=2069355 RepID=UPI001F19742A|nr:helix-turn-helix transcriptional regulator [Lactobacillus sp. ESL0234]